LDQKEITTWMPGCLIFQFLNQTGLTEAGKTGFYTTLD